MEPRVESDGAPRRGNAITRAVGRAGLALLGWRFEGTVPRVPKCVIIVAPHTSNWDFCVGICCLLSVSLRVHWIGKHTLFRWPLGGFMRWLGGTPLRRDSSSGRVAEIVTLLHRHDQAYIGLAPEGTRKRVERWRTGFYHVAEQAGVPIFLAYLDYGRKVAGIGPAFEPTGDLERDLPLIRAFYADKQPRHPQQF